MLNFKYPLGNNVKEYSDKTDHFYTTNFANEIVNVNKNAKLRENISNRIITRHVVK